MSINSIRTLLEDAVQSHSDKNALLAGGEAMSYGELFARVNQVASYFNYVNRTVNGLGVNIQGDILGLSPSDAEGSGSWKHV